MTQSTRVRLRLCLCCGTASETPAIPACWDHWQLLPEELRSSIVKSSARVQLTLYAKAITEAVAAWREAGAWRPKRHAVPAPATTAMPLPALQRLLLSEYGRQTNELGRLTETARTTGATRPAAAKRDLDTVLRSLSASRPDRGPVTRDPLKSECIQRQVAALRALSVCGHKAVIRVHPKESVISE